MISVIWPWKPKRQRLQDDAGCEHVQRALPACRGNKSHEGREYSLRCRSVQSGGRALRGNEHQSQPAAHRLFLRGFCLCQCAHHLSGCPPRNSMGSEDSVRRSAVWTATGTSRFGFRLISSSPCVETAGASHRLLRQLRRLGQL